MIGYFATFLALTKARRAATLGGAIFESQLELHWLTLHHDLLREELGRKSRRLVRGLDRAGAARKGRKWFLKLADEQSSAAGLQNTTVKKNNNSPIRCYRSWCGKRKDGNWINGKRN